MVYIYFHDYQSAMFDRIKNTINNVVGFQNLYGLGDITQSSEPNYLIVISQPTLSITLKLEKIKWDKIIIFEGVRWNTRLEKIFFSDESIIEEIIMQEELNFHMNLRRKYISNLLKEETLDESDIRYLQEISGEIFEAKSVKKDKSSNFYWKGIITIVGSLEWSIKASRAITRLTNSNIIIVDGDLLSPSLDCILGFEKLQTPIKSHIKGVDNTGFNIALDAIAKNAPFESHASNFVKKVDKNLHVLFGNYNAYNYEHYDEASLKVLVEKLNQIYDIVIVLVSTSVYDLMTLLSIHISDINVFVVEDKPHNLRYIRSILDILINKQKIPKRKNKIVLIESQKKIFTESLMKGLFGSLYLGRDTLDMNYFAKFRTNNLVKKMLVERKICQLLNR